jgi:hypothetical protein
VGAAEDSLALSSFALCPSFLFPLMVKMSESGFKDFQDCDSPCGKVASIFLAMGVIMVYDSPDGDFRNLIIGTINRETILKIL